jgi:hypothetical protein
MATVTLSRYECSADLLPKVCASCGAPATDRVSHTFTWRPGWAESESMTDWLTNRTATVRLPLCPEHAGHARRKNRFVAITLVPLFGLIALIVAWELDLLPLGVGPDLALGLTAGVAVLLWAWIGTIYFFFSDRFRPVEITDRFLTLRGVNRQFVAAVEAGLEPDSKRQEDRPSTTAERDHAANGAPGVAEATEVIVVADEYQTDRLPPVCARCGAPAVGRVPRPLRLFPQRLACLLAIPFLATLIFCPPLFILLLVLAGKRVPVHVPTCAEHENSWDVWDRVGRWFIIPTWALVATGLTACAILDSEHRWLYVGGSVLVFVSMLVLERVMGRDVVLVLQAEGTDVRLRHVNPAFVAALTEDRERHRPAIPERPRRVENEWDDYDDDVLEPPPRRPSRDDWHHPSR